MSQDSVEDSDQPIVLWLVRGDSCCRCIDGIRLNLVRPAKREMTHHMQVTAPQEFNNEVADSTKFLVGKKTVEKQTRYELTAISSTKLVEH